MNANLITHDLGNGILFIVGMLLEHLIWTQEEFDTIWNMHPLEKHKILMHGQWVEIPRWQQAYGKDYHFSGTVKEAEPTPEILLPLIHWIQQNIDERLNGILMNYYEGPDMYIGAHHDSVKNMIKGAPIVTVSLGETRVFRLFREEKRDGKKVVAETRDFPMPPGNVLVMPYNTNLAWKHGVPKSMKYSGRRISVTFRAFEE